MGKASQYLDRTAILAAPRVTYAEVNVPDWGGTVRVRSLTAAERDDYEQELLTGKGKNRDVNLRHARAKLVVRCVVDDQGKQVFQESDWLSLSETMARPVDAIFDAASRLSGIRDEDLDELGKPSEPTPNVASRSD